VSGWIPEGDRHEVFVAGIPTCPKHGQMHAHIFLGSDGDAIAQVIDYTCAGYDGEGCEYKVPIEYRLLGYADEINFEP
jgi:hypothetical protein